MIIDIEQVALNHKRYVLAQEEMREMLEMEDTRDLLQAAAANVMPNTKLEIVGTVAIAGLVTTATVTGMVSAPVAVPVGIAAVITQNTLANDQGEMRELGSRAWARIKQALRRTQPPVELSDPPPLSPETSSNPDGPEAVLERLTGIHDKD